MNGRLIRAVLFVLGYLCASLGTWYAFDDQPSRSTIADGAFVQGFSRRSFVAEDGAASPYVCFIPNRETEGARPGVILYLNGFGENGDDGLMQIFENFGQPVWEMKRRFPFVVVTPQCPIGESWDPERPPIQQALKILDHVCAATNADPDRVYLVGVSSGAGSIWSIATHYSDRFAAIVPISSARPAGDSQKIASDIADSGIPVWAGFNRLDKEVFTEFNREMKSALLRSGSSPYYFEHNARGHDCWNRTFRSPSLYDWLLRQNRRTRVTEPFQLIDVNNMAASFESSAGATWTGEPDGRLRSPVALDTDELLLSRDAVQNFEIHAEFLAGPDAVHGFSFQMVNDDSKDQTRWILKLCDPESGGSHLSIENPHEWIVDTDPLAQRSVSPTEWNDLRLRVQGERLWVEINGWKALQISDQRLSVGTKRFGLFQGKAAATPTEWRWIRTRSSLDARVPDHGMEE
jgi:pimeloyl-ACP methyl ester carboxylesterase